MKTFRSSRVVSLSFFLVAEFFVNQSMAYAFSGTEGASFLEIPVGARPAAMGNAYSALADDAYAPTINPAGLGFLLSPQVAGMHLIYLENTSYEYLSYVNPIGATHGVGASIQYFRPGDITGRGINDQAIGDVSGEYVAASLSYGQQLVDRLSLGVTGRFIQGKIDNVSASSYAAEFGLLYKLSPEVRFSAVADNVGKKLTFLDTGDSLPMLYRVGAAYIWRRQVTMSVEGVRRQSGLDSAATGIEYQTPLGFSVRAGYDTERTRQLSAMAGLTLGFAFSIYGHELAYAWAPMGDLGDSQYLSFVLHFGKERENIVRDQGYSFTPDHSAGGNDELDTLPDL